MVRPRQPSSVLESYQSLNGFVDLINSAVVAYSILLLAEQLGSFWGDPKAPSFSLLRVALIVFVFLHALSDAIEARVLTGDVPYTGVGRFMVDVVIAILFAFSLAASAFGSATLLITLAAAYLFGALWASILHRDAQKRSKPNSYPSAYAIASGCAHVVMAGIFFGLWLYMRRIRQPLFNREAFVLMLAYYFLLAAVWIVVQRSFTFESPGTCLCPLFFVERLWQWAFHEPKVPKRRVR